MIRRCWNEIFAARDRRPIYEWAHDNVKLGSAYTITGYFNIEQSRHLIEPFRALQDDAVKTVCVRAPVRSGKTLLADVWLPWVIVQDPGPFMWNMQSDKIAGDHAETRVMPNLEACDKAAALFPITDRHKKRKQEIMFSSGMPLYIQGPSIGNLQSKGVRYLVNDEVWCWDHGRLAHALGRTGDFDAMGSSKVLNLSQGGIVGDDEDVEWSKGSQSEWEVPCLSCGAYQPAEIRGVRGDGTFWGLTFDDVDPQRDKAGELDVNKVLATVRFECRECRHIHTNERTTRDEWNRLGKYKSYSETHRRNHVSFHWGGPICRSWVDLAEELVHALNALARGVVEPLIVYCQKREAKPWSEDRLFAVKPSKTYTPNTEAWADEECRFMTVDRQAGGLHWCQIRAWSKRGETRRLWFGKLIGEDEILAKQVEYEVESQHVLIDSGYEAKVVYGMCCRHGWIALKGEEKTHFIHASKDSTGKVIGVQRSYSKAQRGDPEIGTAGAGKRFATLILWSNPTIKDRLQRLIERGLWQEPASDPNDELELEYRRQMRAEYKRQKQNRVTGRTEMVWVCPSGNNHAFDCAAMQVVAATIKRLIVENQESSHSD